TVSLSGTRKGKPAKWTFNVGKESADNKVVYVNSSDRPDRAFPVLRSSIESLFFKDTAELRSKRLFDFVESNVASLAISEGKDELRLQKVDNCWRCRKPDLGFADFESPPGVEDKKEPKAAASGIKSLINAIAHLQVDNENDFEPVGTDLAQRGLENG